MRGHSEEDWERADAWQAARCDRLAQTEKAPPGPSPTGPCPSPHEMSTQSIPQNQNIHNHARLALEELRRRHPGLDIVEIARLMAEVLETATGPMVARLQAGLAICNQIHRDEPRAPHFQSSYPVSLAGLTRQDGRNWSMSGRERR